MLRPYQTRAIDDLRTCYQSGRRAPVLILPTGAGKTVVASEVIRMTVARGGRVLFLVHRNELLTQSVSKLERAGVTDLRIIQAGSDLGSRTAPVVVASIPTLTRWTDRHPAASLVIIDEAHHVAAKTWRKLADHYSASLLLGLTATPARQDGKALGDIFDSIVVGATVAELVSLGHLVPCRVFAPPDKLEAKHIAVSPVEAYRKHGEGQRAVIFCVTVEHAQRTADEMNAAGIGTAVVHGELGRAERAKHLADLEHGRIQAVASIGVLTEGWDSPAVAVCILARKPQHTGLYLQMVGRVLRPSPGKTHATLIDLCGSVHDHGPPDMDREYTLDGRGISKVDRDQIRQCLSCGAVFKVGPSACPLCGVELPRRMVELPTALGLELIDLGSLPKLPPRPITLSITAKFPGTCRGCRGRIAVGQQVYWVKGSGAKHVDCGAVEVAA
jgi:DNA repair protein RadD